MARRLSWSDVRGGLLATAAIAVVVFGVLRYARVGALHGDTFPLYALVGEARELSAGSEVWLSGQKVGKINRIEFIIPTVHRDTAERLLIEMEIEEKYRGAMRRDAVAQIRAGGSVIGSPVVYLSPGTSKALVIRSNDTVRARSQADFEGAASQFGYASRDFAPIISSVRDVAAQLGGTKGTVGAFLNTPGGGELTRARLNATRLGNRLSGNGTIGLVMRGGLSARAGRVMARVDSVRALLASSTTSLGRFRRDSTLASEVADIRNELTLVQALLHEPRGTVGRAMTDSALTNALADAQRQMGLLFADIKKHPLRYLSF